MLKKFEFNIHIIQPTYNPLNDWIDAHIRLKDGRVFYASFFTIQCVIDSIKKWNKDKTLIYWKQNGECPDESFFWAADSIIVPEIDLLLLNVIIESMLKSGYFFKAFSDITEAINNRPEWEKTLLCPCPEVL